MNSAIRHPDHIKKQMYTDKLQGCPNENHVISLQRPASQPNTGLAGRFLPDFDRISPVPHWDNSSAKEAALKRNQRTYLQRIKRAKMGEAK